MNPKIWGPHLWYILHLISFEYPENPNEYDKRIYHDFYTSLKDVIPCLECKKHYRDYITKFPLSPHLDNKNNLIKWVIQVHNFVNASLNKPILNYNQVINIYNELKPISPFENININYINKLTNSKLIYKLYTLIIILAIIIYFINYYFNKYYFNF